MVIQDLISYTGYDIYSKQFNSEIVNRLAYTLIDPFYDEFIENNK